MTSTAPPQVSTLDSDRRLPKLPVVPVAIAVCLALGLAAQVPLRAETRSEDSPGLSQLAFLVGSWRAESGGTTLEELWMSARGGVMLGLNRTVIPNGIQWEFLRLEETVGDDGDRKIVYWASPGGAPPTPFTLAEVGPGHAVFANPGHDFPQRIIYRRTGEQLRARVEAGEGDAVRGFDLEWSLVAELD
ncbi:MAG: DUF6265 family protein [Thermoanaerobaculia bacterium]|nr:DUF6265 family protein [Thermoanaerobaculia bacterium]